MNTPGKFIYGIVTIGILLFQLMSPTLVHADAETPPPPSDTPAVTSTPETPPTEVVPTESPTTESATDVAVTESPTADPILITPVSTATVPSDVTPTDPASATVDSVETNTPAETATLVPTESATETLPAESPTPDVSAGTPAPTDSSTPDTSSNTPISTATEPSILTPTDSASPTIDPAETSTPIPTQPETLEPPSDTPAGTSTSIPMESTTETTPLELPTQGDPATDAIPTEILQGLPEETEVVVLDENGQALSLVTQEVIDIIANSDPMWCPDGVAPGGVGCTPSYATMNLLLTTEGSNINAQNVNGTIWITSGTVSDINPIDINSSLFSSYPNWAEYSLTLQGGWSGINGDTTIGSNSIFSVPINISSWQNNVTVNNITVNNSAGNGVRIDTTKNVTISNSTFSRNSIDGAWLAANNVSITNSTFNGNLGDGATIYSPNTTISNSTFDGNSTGLSIDGGIYDSYGNLVGTGCVTTVNNVYRANGQNKSITNAKIAPCMEPNVTPTPLLPPTSIILVPPGQDFVEFSLDCTRYSSFLIWLPNGDRVVISCVVSGTVRISRLDNTTLPQDLPAGYEYASAFKVEIFQNGVSLPVITTGGSVLASFASRHEDHHYSIMVWDEKIKGWRTLDEYLINPNGAPVVFPFDRSNLEDARRILSGARFIATYDPDREEVTTNFPGSFVLVQQQ